MWFWSAALLLHLHPRQNLLSSPLLCFLRLLSPRSSHLRPSFVPFSLEAPLIHLTINIFLILFFSFFNPSHQLLPFFLPFVFFDLSALTPSIPSCFILFLPLSPFIFFSSSSHLPLFCCSPFVSFPIYTFPKFAPIFHHSLFSRDLPISLYLFGIIASTPLPFILFPFSLKRYFYSLSTLSNSSNPYLPFIPLYLCSFSINLLPNASHLPLALSLYLYFFSLFFLPDSSHLRLLLSPFTTTSSLLISLPTARYTAPVLLSLSPLV